MTPINRLYPIPSACYQTCAIAIKPVKFTFLPILLTVSCFFFLIPSYAQLQEYPLHHPTQSNHTSSSKNARTQADPLVLPFFDDFSTYAGKPDANLWETKGGVVINNTSAVNPPSKGVATFNGLSFSGSPYNFDRQVSQAPTDTLTSNPINLEGLAASNVYLSFFWQAQGLGELPDPTDSLVLQFKTADTVWQSVRSFRGQILADFKQEILPVPAPYCHANFQFRFQLFGRPSGAYDAWHIDYIYLNRNRNASDRFVRDIAVVNQPGSLLKNYMAMPLNQFRANPAAELKDSVSTSIFNLQDRGIFTTYSFTLENLWNGQTLSSANFPTSIPVNSLTRQTKAIRLDPTALVPPTADSMLLKYTFNINTGDDNTTIPSVDLRRNDTIAGTSVLHNYYAYDDGTAEYGLGLRQRQGRVACKFTLNESDTLTAIRIYFTRLERDLKGQTFVLRIWRQLDESRESVLYEKSVPIQYSDTLNKFVTYTLTPSVIVADSFYVGWQQSTDDILAVGLDKNTDTGNQLFYNIAGVWQPNTEVQGSAMIRPVFGRVDVVGLEDELQENAFSLYPNPTDGLLTWNETGVKAIEVFDVLGRKVKHRLYQPSDSQMMNLESLPNGLYVLYIHFQNRTFVKKVMLRR